MEEESSDGSKARLVGDDVEVVLMRLERARKAIQEIRPVLLNYKEKEQPRFCETEKIYLNFIDSLKSGRPMNEDHEADRETDPELLISKTAELLDKLSVLIRANKARIVLTRLGNKPVKTRSLRVRPPRDADPNDEMSPEQTFYYQLADSDLV